MSDSSHDAKDNGAAEESNSTAAGFDSDNDDPDSTARFAPGWNQTNQQQSHLYDSEPQAQSPSPSPSPGMGSPHPSQDSPASSQ
ncbi:MAG: hypothetical protein L0G69_15045, partial [Brevibacterium sp.]|nr:hypothetical protein [Brevibacterium sp.]